MKYKRFSERMVSLLLSLVMVIVSTTPLSASSIDDGEPAEYVEASEFEETMLDENVFDDIEEEDLLDDGFESDDPELADYADESLDTGIEEEEESETVDGAEESVEPQENEDFPDDDSLEQSEDADEEFEEELSCGEDADAEDIVSEEESSKEEAFYEFEDRNIYVTAILKHPEAVPDGAEFKVTRVTPDVEGYNYEAYMEALNKGAADSEKASSYTDENTLLYDIAFMIDELDEEGNPTGNRVEYHPENDDIEIAFSFKKAQLSEQMGAESSDSVNVFHLPLAEEVIENVASTKDATDISADDITVDGIETKIEDLGIDIGDDETATFTTDGFSVFAFTVDFSYLVNGKMYDFSLPGGGFVSFTDLIEVLGIIEGTNSGENDVNSAEVTDEDALTLSDVTVSEETRKFVADVESVEFSNPDLVWVGKVETDSTVGEIKEANGLECEYSAELTEEQIEEINAQTVESGDWALISMLPFESEESLTVTMKTGEVFTIKVTDAQIIKTVIDAKGDTWEITVTYGEDAGIPNDAELKAEEILPEDARYQEYYQKAVEAVSGETAKDNYAHL
ncbi:MAG: hypothetical protein IJX90_03030, partial [Blautia sp.]|nr:hypothetical protein [Blautia sp.]MBQ9329175.1 hypothetical protein [Solobacterium sp.]